MQIFIDPKANDENEIPIDSKSTIEEWPSMMCGCGADVPQSADEWVTWSEFYDIMYKQLIL